LIVAVADCSDPKLFPITGEHYSSLRSLTDMCQRQDVVTVNHNRGPCFLLGCETWSLSLNVRLNKGWLDKKLTTHIFWNLYFQI